ncbi:MAG: hypothetical protein HN550_05885 [Deltaproteobacteria bacterium]|nr:hypothetical protein [Deltaproteobacteria bacterium]
MDRTLEKKTALNQLFRKIQNFSADFDKKAGLKLKSASRLIIHSVLMIIIL